jgi:hypothetical protein
MYYPPLYVKLYTFDAFFIMLPNGISPQLVGFHERILDGLLRDLVSNAWIAPTASPQRLFYLVVGFHSLFT